METLEIFKYDNKYYFFPAVYNKCGYFTNELRSKINKISRSFSKRTVELKSMIFFRAFLRFLFIISEIQCNKKKSVLKIMFKVNFACFYKSPEIQDRAKVMFINNLYK